jgi:prevent-host-death family protein
LETPMKSIGAFEAKTHLSELLERVSRGEKFTITRHGVPAAVLVPPTEAAPRLTHQEVVLGMGALRKRVKPDKMSVRDMVKEGRRF